MVTALRDFTLLGDHYQYGGVVPEAQWERVPLQNQRAMERSRFVTRKPLSARARIADATDPLACWCGYLAKSKQALGGHTRGHTKRGEAPKEG